MSILSLLGRGRKRRARIDQALSFQRLGKYEDALDVFVKLIWKYPKDRELWLYLHELFIEMRQLTKAKCAYKTYESMGQLRWSNNALRSRLQFDIFSPVNAYFDDRLQEDKKTSKKIKMISKEKLNELCVELGQRIGDEYVGPNVLMTGFTGKQSLQFFCRKGTYIAVRTEEGLVVKNSEGSQIAVFTDIDRIF